MSKDSRITDWPGGFKVALNRVVEDCGSMRFMGEHAEIEAESFAHGLRHMRDIVFRLGAVYGSEDVTNRKTNDHTN